MWQIAERCGLSPEFLGAPDNFNIGKNGRNIPLASRQALSIARGILSDADVLLLVQPFNLLDPDHTEKVVPSLLVVPRLTGGGCGAVVARRGGEDGLTERVACAAACGWQQGTGGSMKWGSMRSCA